MNAGTIVGYVTKPNGNPVGGAEIWISSPDDGAQIKPAAKTDSRGYFQLTVSGAGIAGVVGGGNLNVSVGAGQDGRTVFANRAAPENSFRVTGYLIN